MPKIKSAQKAARVAERNRLRNKSVRSATKTSVTRAEEVILSNDAESAQQAVVDAISTLDKATKKGVLHRNTAARHKSRLMKKFNQATMPKTAEPDTTDPDTA